MDLIVWARDNPVLVVAAVAIAALVVVAMRMARVPDSAEEPHPAIAERPALERAAPPRAPFTRPVPAAAPAPSTFTAPPAPQLSPAGYVPLEVPELWEPPVGYLGVAGPPSSGPVRAAAPGPSVQPSYPARYPLRAAPFVQPAPRAQTPASAPPAASAPSRTPRSFDDLRRGVLAGRSFESLQQFAVAAVVEAGHPVVLVARIFRVPTWKLESWVEAAFQAAPAPTRRPWRGTMPRAV
ncbi:hypothetical protein QE374_001257 [Microbacterium sp. SORGH_AS428]|uniref:hypothetical protein n=1 Tax=Microbacterium sp. SORGH_AS_0428 TaxID=3041788 RepID=UPI0028576ADF|nr:hypothetical protein [Microbacterium sp. SORGH_AS_0428]MDR6199348.1 hypothetical protein [Microbacterium sp. SORGH_AS_0428]